MTDDTNPLSIIFYPDPRLRQPAESIEPTDPKVRATALHMLQLMHEAKGVGLAAPQVGLGWRLFVTNHTGDPAHDLIYINPVLTDPSSDTESASEGCLSIPGVNVDVRRPRQITIRAYDLDGNDFTINSDQLQARIWQHEFDHLDGNLIIDRMSPLDRLANRKAIKELETGFTHAKS